jgi:hypothetical protein
LSSDAKAMMRAPKVAGKCQNHKAGWDSRVEERADRIGEFWGNSKTREEMERAGSPSYSFDDLGRRRDRKRRNQRIAAGVVGIAVFVAAIWVVTTAGSFDRTTPADKPTVNPADTAKRGRSRIPRRLRRL